MQQPSFNARTADAIDISEINRIAKKLENSEQAIYDEWEKSTDC